MAPLQSTCLTLWLSRFFISLFSACIHYLFISLSLPCGLFHIWWAVCQAEHDGLPVASLDCKIWLGNTSLWDMAPLPHAVAMPIKQQLMLNQTLCFLWAHSLFSFIWWVVCWTWRIDICKFSFHCNLLLALKNGQSSLEAFMTVDLASSPGFYWTRPIL